MSNGGPRVQRRRKTMILGMSLATFTLVHVIISLLGIAAGFVVMYGMLTSNRMPGMTAFFLITTIATSVTGFMFPLKQIGPPHIVGAISLVVLAFTLIALYGYHLSGRWRATYVSTAIVAQWFNVFVLIVQMFQKIPALNAFAPKGNEPPFAIAQGVVLLAFVVWGWLALKRFHPAVTSTAPLRPALS
jgi:hypothetical protein